ncbi:hypothetical protein SAMN06265360_11244 [Haloechinothrix alba]|uniref:Uncharacterized protein n=1 Tax=Haloechinothrix alba TaxID=664784 RepID=A0A238XRZ7_9PSEU|nr:hypothetical protein [Haloechinothrix alba]SNR61765.1 hypothetical protein SAMN06265360_11244 [Haloechinothrix alba]
MIIPDVPAPTTMAPVSMVSCEQCTKRLTADEYVEVTVPDSGYLHPDDPDQDGRRVTYACSTEHAEALEERGTTAWVDEQLWARRVQRVSTYWRTHRMTLDQFAARAGLTSSQLNRALRWRMGVRTDSPQQPTPRLAPARTVSAPADT